MPKGISSKITFKTDKRKQEMLLPPNLEEMVGKNDIARLIDKVVGEIDISPLMQTYKGGGTSIYDPAMMLKVIFYSYVNKIYTSRQIARALRENIKYMWLSGMQAPDFRTINNFRSGRMMGIMEELFGSIIGLLIEKGYISTRAIFIDGTKLEADANKNSHVWSKNTERFKATIQEKVKQLFGEIEQLNREEDKLYGDNDLEELSKKPDINSDEVKEQLKQISEQLHTCMEEKQALSEKEKKIEKAAKQVEKELLPRLEKYEEQEAILAGRGSYSKTDPDATFHRMKDGLTLPSYNLMISTENQIIINYSVHQNPGETQLLIEHLQKMERTIGIQPKDLVGDSAFGSQENYSYLEEKGIGNYLKYNTFFRETQGKYSEYYERADFDYNPVGDYFVCPYLKKLNFKEIRQSTTEHGYEVKVRVYASEDCTGCPYSSKCRRGNSNRAIQVNEELDRLRKQAWDNLHTNKGIDYRSQRGVDVEPVFGDIKRNFGFRRFHLRGLKKVEIEFGIIAIAHNLKKMHQMLEKMANSQVISSFFVQFYINFQFLRLIYLIFVLKRLGYANF